MITQDFAGRHNYLPQMLGVVYTDRNENDRYDASEGIGGVTIDVVGEGEKYTTTSMSAGGYQLPVPKGTYTLYASGRRLTGPLVVTDVVMDGSNVKVDVNTKKALRPPLAVSDSVNTMEDAAVTVAANRRV